MQEENLKRKLEWSSSDGETDEPISKYQRIYDSQGANRIVGLLHALFDQKQQVFEQLKKKVCQIHFILK